MKCDFCEKEDFKIVSWTNLSVGRKVTQRACAKCFNQIQVKKKMANR